MTRNPSLRLEPKMRAAVDELQALIRRNHPEVQFRLGRDPEGSAAIHLIAVLDVEDTDLVVDEFIDRMMQLQIDEQLPLWVIPVRTAEREIALRAATQAKQETAIPRP